MGTQNLPEVELLRQHKLGRRVSQAAPGRDEFSGKGGDEEPGPLRQ